MDPERNDPARDDNDDDILRSRSISLLSDDENPSYIDTAERTAPVAVEPTEYTPVKFGLSRKTKNFISTQYESLDYDTADNVLLIEEEERKGYKYILNRNIMKWVVFLLIGTFTAIVASFVELMITYIFKAKNSFLFPYLEVIDYKPEELYVPWVAWSFINLIPIMIGSLLVTYIQPIAAGSGIPYIKCYLNGVDLPRVVELRTLIVKALGLACTIGGGVASGKEGPMIHVGSCCANVMTGGRIVCCGKRLISFFKFFRDDKEKRDFVSAGAATGVAAAFGAPVGGVLFSLEESSSFWNQNLTWKIFFGSVISTFTVNLILSWLYGSPGELIHPSLINLGSMNYTNDIYEIPVFAVIGMMGGIFGAFWNFCNSKMTIFRARFIKKKWVKIVEIAFISVLTSTTAFLMSYYAMHCIPHDSSYKAEDTPKVFCVKDGEYNKVASMWLKMQHHALSGLLNDESSSYHPACLVAFAFFYFLLSTLTFGMSASSGIFVPALMIGASWGRLAAHGIAYIFPTFIREISYNKYALVGAAATLGGLVRMTISLTVIIMEASHNVKFSLPIIVTVLCAKWTGDFFNEGIYMIIIRLKKIPFLMFDPPPLAHNITAYSVMKYPALCIQATEQVHFLVDMLDHCTHNGFPVIESSTNEEEGPRHGKIVGIMLRSQILLILKRRWFRETIGNWRDTITQDVIRDAYGQIITLKGLHLSFEENECTVDFEIFMSRSPVTLRAQASLPKMFRVFRAIGLRHLPIVNDNNEVVGMVSRKDLAKFIYMISKGKLILEKCPLVDAEETLE